MAARTRSYAIYNADDHGAAFEDISFAMQIPDDEIAETQRGWVAAAGGEDRIPVRLTPRYVGGRDPLTGRRARCIVASVAAQLWDGTISTFSVSGVTYTVTGFTGEKRTAVAV